MNIPSSTNENQLVGKWIKKGISLVEDSTCKRINWLIENVFSQIAVDGANWTALYKDKDNNFWELSYPNSDFHGGGPPTLTHISTEEANQKYPKIDLS